VAGLSRLIVALMLAASGTDVCSASALRAVTSFRDDAPALRQSLGHAQYPAEVRSSAASGHVSATRTHLTPADGDVARTIPVLLRDETSPLAPVGERTFVSPAAALTIPGRAPPLAI
jgi:hypothetical protein